MLERILGTLSEILCKNIMALRNACTVGMVIVLVHGTEVKLQASIIMLLLHYNAVHMCCCFATMQYICAVALLQCSTYVLLLH